MQKDFHPDKYLSSSDFLREAKRYDMSLSTVDMLRLKVALGLPRLFRPSFLIPNILGKLSRLDNDLRICRISRSCKHSLAGNNYNDNKRYYSEQQSLKKIQSIIEEMMFDNQH